ncbi:MAG: DEAD/DEAH box helicase [Nanoarchaeota archaeon]|nr:DEAD/DEAH box helicase [Nanoarchaeota archaeon]
MIFRMAGDFFDENILKIEEEEYSIISNYRDLTYNLKKFDGYYQLSLEIKGERLNSSEMKALLSLNETKNIFSSQDVSLINYVIHRLSGTMTIYRIINDFDFIVSNLIESNFMTFFNGVNLTFSKQPYRLSVKLDFDDNSNVVLDVLDEGEFIFSLDKVFFIKVDVLYILPEEIPVKFYREIFSGNNKFSIEGFFTLKNSFLSKLKEVHNLLISEEVLKLESLEIEEKVAKAVVEIGKTSHFIVMQLRYMIGDEYYNIEDYMYAETLNWVDKQTSIKVVRDEGKLVRYISDLNISEDVFNEMFEGSRIRFNQTSKSPFLIMLPISNLELFVNKVIPKIETFYDVIYKNGQRLRVIDGNVRFDIETNLKSRLDLFEFKVKFKIEDEYFDVDYLKELMQKSKKYVQLKDGSTVNIENIREINKWIEFLNKFEFKKVDNTYRSESSVALELDEFLKDFKGKEVRSNEEYRNLIQELKEKKPVMEVKLPTIVDNILRDYQKEGVYWLYFLKKYGFNGILADEMGLGKTIQTLTLMEMEKNGVNPHIVICPKSLIYNWENEIKIYFPNNRVLIVDGDMNKRKKLIKTAKDFDIVITSYSMLQKDYREYLESDVKFNYQILDEAHYVKNMKTLSAKAVRLISSRRMILLTGTPLENNLDELYGTFDLIMPAYLGNKMEFSREFVSKIERNNMIALELLQAKIRPFILRRTKKEVLKELPDKQEQVVYNEMTNKQVVVYQEVLNRVKADVNDLIEKQGFNKSRIQVLSALLKLRQVCNHPSLLDDSFIGETNISGKYNQFMELLEEVIDSGKKVLVFSQFTSMLDIFQKDLGKMGISFLRLDGSTKNRQDLVDEFNEDESIKVFLISLKAGGVGLNLTSASAVFLYDPWWNPMVEKQAMDRAHRIGQKKTVNIYKFITRNSIEEKILKLQERKGNMFENLVTEDRGFMKRLEWEDLMELFD